MSWLQKHLGGHVTFKLFGSSVTIYGFNAMHVAINIYTRRWGYICFHPTTYQDGRWWPWKFYLSPDATPSASTFAIGPGVSWGDKFMSTIRRRIFGHNFTYGDEFAEWNRNQRDGWEHLHYLNYATRNRLPVGGEGQEAAQ